MKKAVKANIAGRVFTLDEDAFQRLEKYLKNIEQHFKREKAGEEIISDIETRIVELFTEKLSNNKQVISIKDVNEVINTLGYPENFDDGEKNHTISGDEFEKIYHPKKLYRNPDDAIFGGVCGGLGLYWNVTPVLLRIIFLIALLFFGITLVVYIVLWIMIPKARTISQKLEMRGEKVTISRIRDSKL